MTWWRSSADGSGQVGLLRWPVLGALRVKRIRLVPALPIAVLLLFVVVGIAAPWLTPHDPLEHDLANARLPPAFVEGGSPEHILGTDGYGRDVLARLLYGTRVSLLVATFSLTLAVLIGTSVGVFAGYVGGKVDATLMRAVDIMFSLPSILVALVAAAIVGPSFWNLVLILGLLIWPNIARLIRGETLLLRSADFVRYSRAIGVSRWQIVAGHVLPNVLPVLLVATTLEIANVILTEASLSFLGVGLPPPAASWGVMIDDGRALIATGWWIALFPGLAIMATVLSANALGDWLRDYTDPKTRHE
jgi:peptide/nickel transport system permease protein